MVNPLQKMFQRLGGVEKKDDPAYQMYAQFIAPGQPIYTPRDFRNLATQGYEKNITVFRSISLIAESCAGIPWTLKQKKNKKRIIEDHPVLDLLGAPNPRHGTGTFIEEVVSFWILSGNSYMYAVRPNPRSTPTELWTMRPDRMRVIPGIGTIAGYEYTLDGHRQYYDANDVLHLKMFSASNDWYGLSPVAVASALVDQNNEGFDWNTAILQNAGRPSGALVASGTLGNDQFERLRRVIREKYTGKKNAGVPLLLEGGLDWKQFSMSPLELDWQESRKQNMRDISIALGVPPELIGDASNKTYCLPYETRVETVHGPMPIGAITPGILVYSYDATSNSIVKKRVRRQWKTGTQEVFELKTAKSTIRATANHPFLVAKRNRTGKGCTHVEFVRVDELRSGDILVSVDGAPQETTFVKPAVYFPDMPPLPPGCLYTPLLSLEKKPPVDVYDLEIEQTHTFFAEKLCVHNSNYGEARKSFYQETVLPLMDRLRDRLNVWLIPMFDDSLEFDYDKDQVEALQEDRDSLNNRIMSQWNAGVVTLNEVRNLLGLTELDGADFFNITMANKALVPETMIGEFVTTMLKQTMSGGQQPAAPGAPPDQADGQPQLPASSDTTQDGSGPNPSASPNVSPGQGSGQQGTPTVQDADSQETMGRTIITEIKERREKKLESQQNLVPNKGVEPVRQALRITSQQVIDSIRKAATPQTITDRLEPVWDAIPRALTSGLKICSDQAGAKGAIDTQKNLTSAAYKSLIDIWKQQSAEYALKHGAKNVQHVTETLKKEIQGHLAAGIAQNESVDEIADRLQSFLSEEMLKERAQMIAQTEWTTAYNFGAYSAAASSGMALKKQWITRDDGRERPAHAEVHGQTVDLHAPFMVNGEEMMHPGDSSMGASASNVVRCRCSQVFLQDQKQTLVRIEDLLGRAELKLSTKKKKQEEKQEQERTTKELYKQFQEVVQK